MDRRVKDSYRFDTSIDDAKFRNTINGGINGIGGMDREFADSPFKTG